MEMFNILVVEDDKNLRKLITTCLMKNHYNTYEAINGEEALEVLDRNYIDLIVSDVMNFLCQKQKEYLTIQLIIL